MTFASRFYRPFALSPPVSTDPYATNVVSLMHFNGTGTTFVDQCNRTWSAVGAATQSTSSPILGAASFDNTTANGYITTTDNLGSLNFGTSDFTVEWKQKSAGLGPTGQDIIYEHRNGSAYMLQIWCASRGNLFMAIDTGDYSSDPTSIFDGAVHDIAYTRASGVGRLYFDGVKIVEKPDTQSYGSTASLYLGAGIGTDSPVRARFDEFRITAGVARYTGATYVVDTTEFTNVGVA